MDLFSVCVQIKSKLLAFEVPLFLASSSLLLRIGCAPRTSHLVAEEKRSKRCSIFSLVIKFRRLNMTTLGFGGLKNKLLMTAWDIPSFPAGT